MTKKETTGKRSLEFSRWIKEKLPDSKTGLCVTNQDWVFWNYKTRRLMLIEEKTKEGKLAPWFKIFIGTVLHPALEEYCKKNGIDYRGYHLLKFENTSPDDGKIFWIVNCNGQEEEITEEELIKRLGMEDEEKAK